MHIEDFFKSKPVPNCDNYPIFLQMFFESNPVPEKEGFPINFETNIILQEIDYSLEVSLEGIKTEHN